MVSRHESADLVFTPKTDQLQASYMTIDGIRSDASKSARDP